MSLDTITINTPVNTPAPTIATKRDAILAYHRAHPKASAKQITDDLRVNLQYVYNVLKEAKRGPKVKLKLGRPRKVKSPLEVPLIEEKEGSISYHEYDALRSELMTMTHLAEDRRQEIEELTVIIAYLEHRCARAEGSRGPAI